MIILKMETAKEKIVTAVQEYKRLFPQEYKSFLKSHAITIDNQKDKWGSTGKDSHAIRRHLYDTPEKLHQAITRMLNEHELDWFNARGEFVKNFSGAQWFITRFPEFKVTQEF